MKIGPVGGAARQRGLGYFLLAPLALTAVGAMLVFVLSLALWANGVDVAARHREETLVRHGLAARIAEIERSISPQTNWDEAAARLSAPIDRGWARENLTAFFRQTAGLQTIFVIGADGHAVYASRRGEDAPLSAYDEFVGAGALVADVREAERRRGPIREPESDAPRRMLTAPIQASGFLMVDGRMRLVTASLVQTDFGRARIAGPAPIVVASAPLETAVLAPLRERYQLADLSAEVGRPTDQGPDTALVSLNVLRGGPSLALTWTPRRPGANLLRAAILPVLLVIAAFAATGGLMMLRARRAAAGLLESNRAQGEFLANMSHEIRTPLNGVVAVAGALERTKLTARQSELVRIIRSSGETLERLLSDVLDLSKIETGAVSIEHEPFHLAEAVRAVAALCGPKAEEKDVDLLVEVAPEAERLVIGDVVRLKQILTNLVSNAVKFTDVGHVALRVRPGRAEGSWRFEVQDTGVGFDPADKAKIFGRFQQADGSVTRRYGGSGLGLSISRQLTELMGGVLDCDSRPGDGSTFIAELRLPPAPEQPQAEPVPFALAATPPDDADLEPDAAQQDERVPAEPAERRLRVLLADDHPTNRTVVEVLLTDLDVDLISVENGLEACEAFETGRFDVVLMDMQMPVLDGIGAVRRLREYERRTRATPALVVMLTANAMREHYEASLAAGADLHLPKPIEVSRLFAALEAGMARTTQALAAAS